MISISPWFHLGVLSLKFNIFRIEKFSYFICLSLFVSSVCVLVQWMTPHNQFGQIGNVAGMLLHPKTSPLHILDASTIWEQDQNKTCTVFL